LKNGHYFTDFKYSDSGFACCFAFEEVGRQAGQL
jgi:hypothetical protein